jgi:hypothetical protein
MEPSSRRRRLSQVFGLSAAMAAAVNAEAAALPEAADAAGDRLQDAPNLPKTQEPTITVTTRPAPNAGPSTRNQQVGRCTWHAYVTPTPGPPGLYEIDYKGTTNCDFSTVLTGVATLYKEGRPIDEAPGCDTLGTLCLSADGMTGQLPNHPYRAGYKGTATAPPGQLWNPAAGCTGAGTTEITCVALSNTVTPRY